MNALRSIFARREAGILVMIVLFCLAVGIARPRFLTLAADEIARYFAGHRTRHDLVARAAVTT